MPQKPKPVARATAPASPTPAGRRGLASAAAQTATATIAAAAHSVAELVSAPAQPPEGSAQTASESGAAAALSASRAPALPHPPAAPLAPPPLPDKFAVPLAAVVAASPSPEAAPSLPSAPRESAPGANALGNDAMAAVTESQVAVARAVEALTVEFTGLARSAIAVVGTTATAMLAARSVADAVNAQLGFARQSLEALFGSSARLSDIGWRAADEATRPILSRLGKFSPRAVAGL